MKTDPRIDEYIARAQEFARPILIYLRNLIHSECPEIVETMKWSFPHFMYKDEILCSMASFKAHCSFGFWKASLIPGLSEDAGKKREAMGHFGRITTLKDLPTKKMMSNLFRAAKKLNEEGIKKPVSPKPASDKNITVPDFILKELVKNKKAQANFEKFSYSHRKEYVQWITEAKTEATRQKRLAQMMEWVKEGKDRHWKYKNC